MGYISITWIGSSNAHTNVANQVNFKALNLASPISDGMEWVQYNIDQNPKIFFTFYG